MGWTSLVVPFAAPAAAALDGTRDIVGPAGSVCFGETLRTLPNGNILVGDPCRQAFTGALYLYDGATLDLISTLTGSTPGDRVGNGVRVLASGNFIVPSPLWDRGPIVDAGAVTFGNATTGVSGAISPANSLVGASALDTVGGSTVQVLDSGNYVVLSPSWNRGAVVDAGAATFGLGTVGVVGEITPANSLVGTSAGDGIGSRGMERLENGNYLVVSPLWNDGAIVDVGAVTWGSGVGGVTGEVSLANSLVGRTASDMVGVGDIGRLANGNYVVASDSWHLGTARVGAATWVDGSAGTSGRVDAGNSLIGGKEGDFSGVLVIPLTNGSYVVSVPNWDNGVAVDAGAVAWGGGSASTIGTIAAANSLIGTTAGDQIGSLRALELSNGNYVVPSPRWHNGAAAAAGAVTWGNGATGTTGAVSPANSLVGTAAGDRVGDRVRRLVNGNYVVSSPNWSNGAVPKVGATTWASGLGGTTGPVSVANSLVGSVAEDGVGSYAVALTNGNYVVANPGWNNGAVVDAGAVTWGNGSIGVTGPVAAANSLVGSSTLDMVGGQPITALTNGNYVVSVPDWDRGGVLDAGATTWADGAAGVVGPVSATNSLVGSVAGDGLLSFTVDFDDGNYVVASRTWDNGTVVDAGAVTWGDGLVGVRGTISADNSLVGSSTNDRVGSTARVAVGASAVIVSETWDNGAVVDAGAVTPLRTDRPLTGPLTPGNSVIGGAAGAGLQVFPLFESVRRSWLVPRISEARVTVLGQPRLTGVVPGRVAETRVGEAVGTVDGLVQATGPVVGGSVLEVPVAGRAGVPVDAAAVVLNVAVTEPQGAGFVTVFPCGSSRPTASSLNYAAGETISNAVTAKVGSNGRVCVYSHATAHVVIDVVASVRSDSGFVASNPARVAETRVGEAVGTVDGLVQATGPVVGGSVLEVPVAGRAGVPVDAAAVVLNVAVTEPQGAGFVTVFPCGSPRPTASSLNHGVAQTISNMVVAKVGSNGRVCVYSHATAHVVIDVVGWHTARSTFAATNPARIAETRTGQAVGTVDGLVQGTGPVPAGAVLEVPVAGRAGVLTGADVAVLNVAVTEPQGAGFVTVFPCGSPRPTASSLNYATGQTIANNVTARLGTGGRICVYTHATTHVVIDLVGADPTPRPTVLDEILAQEA